MSIAASGSIGGAITFGRLKGQNVARLLVTPANPNTAAQQSQRTKLTDSVGEWHTAGLTALDVEAYNRWASASYRKMSGYNLFTSQRIKYFAQAGTAIPAFNVLPSTPAAAQFALAVDFQSAGVVTCYVGTTKTSQATAYIMNDDTGDKYSDTIDSLAASTTYYFYLLFEDAAGKTYRSGLYTYATIA